MAQPAARAQISVGDTTITYLPDGYGWLNPTVFFPASAPDGWATHAEFLNVEGWFPVSIGSFLIRAADRVILVDLGLGAVDFGIPDMATFKGGSLPEALAAEGLSPAHVDTVVYTHLHHDHVGWTSNVAPAPNAAEGQIVTGLTFAGARHLVSETEWRHWSGSAELVGPDPVAVQQPVADAVAFFADDEESDTFSAAVSPGKQVVVLEDVAEDPPSQPGPVIEGHRGQRRTGDHHLTGGRVLQAARDGEQRRLPDPLGPMTATSRPASTETVTSIRAVTAPGPSP
jgi:glyoxylase-like metal-dependent hydrolase (beta-lactamase superfamily II)